MLSIGPPGRWRLRAGLTEGSTISAMAARYVYDDSDEASYRRVDLDEINALVNAGGRPVKDPRKLMHLLTRVRDTMLAIREETRGLNRQIAILGENQSRVGQATTLSPLDAVRYLDDETRELMFTSIARERLRSLRMMVATAQRTRDELEGELALVRAAAEHLAQRPELSPETRAHFTRISGALPMEVRDVPTPPILDYPDPDGSGQPMTTDILAPVVEPAYTPPALESVTGPAQPNPNPFLPPRRRSLSDVVSDPVDAVPAEPAGHEDDNQSLALSPKRTPVDDAAAELSVEDELFDADWLNDDPTTPDSSATSEVFDEDPAASTDEAGGGSLNDDAAEVGSETEADPQTGNLPESGTVPSSPVWRDPWDDNDTPQSGYARPSAEAPAGYTRAVSPVWNDPWGNNTPTPVSNRDGRDELFT